jgi:hypothetical protein
LIAGSIQARKIKALGDYKFSDRIILVFIIPQMGIRKSRIRQIVVCPGFQFLRGNQLRIGLQLFIIGFNVAQHPVYTGLRLQSG